MGLYYGKGMVKGKMYFIITVDTEGDNLWKIKQCSDGVADITNRNGAYIERFQLLCEKYHLIPTYFVNHEMAQPGAFIELGREAVKRKKCEIGMHMHAWNSPPISKLPRAAGRKYGKPYAGEYALPVLNAKMEYLHKELEEVFSTSITSHRGGRWYFDEQILDFLIKHHYLADATVTPGITWENIYGNHRCGCNYKHIQMRSYELNRHNILQEGKSGIIEVPPTIMKLPIYGLKCRDAVTMRERFAKKYWLRPNGNNLKEMLFVMEKAYSKGYDYLQLMIHSSELMPGGSPTFKTEKSIEQLYYDLEIVFAIVARYCKGIGVSDYAKRRCGGKKERL